MTEISITATRYHDFSCGHRVVGHEGKCALLHGHNYRVHFTCAAEQLDGVGRVVDFSVMKDRLCSWLESCWDHKFLAWENDKLLRNTSYVLGQHACVEEDQGFHNSIVWVPFNPTAENMAAFLLKELNPLLKDTGCRLIKVVVEETRKCSATAEL